MIFRIKHCWWLTLMVTACAAMGAALLGGWSSVIAGPLAVHWQVVIGIGGGGAALAVNGVLHEILKRGAGERYVRRFEDYGRQIIDGMRWPHYVLGGVMAAIGEEPVFRGVLMSAFDQPVVGITVAAVVFAACHWLSRQYFGFWFWAVWEGVLFGVLAVATGSLLVPMIAHGVHDVSAYAVIRSLVSAQPTGDERK